MERSGALPGHIRSLAILVLMTGLMGLSLGPAQATQRTHQVFAPDVSKVPATTPEFEAVKQAAAAAMAQANVPGAAIGISANGRMEIATLGVTDVESNLPVTTETLFQNGSVTKTYTAAAIMKLVEEGAIELHAPVRVYVPELTLEDENVASDVTIQHLLTHTGDWWGDAFVDTGEGDDAIEAYVRDVMPRLPQLAPLGRYVSYTNAGFVLLGHVIEKVTGQPYREAIEELVFEPAGIEATLDPSEVESREHATGYAVGTEGLQKVDPQYLPRSVDPAGGIWTTVEDQLRYARFHLNDATPDGERFLEEETIELMQTPHAPVPPAGENQVGLPWIMAAVEDMTIVDHAGQTFGQSAQVTLVPERSFAIVVLTNSFSGMAVSQAALNAALTSYLGVGAESPEEPPAEPTPPTLPNLSEAELAEYLGRYEAPTVAIDVIPAEEGLAVTYTPKTWPGQVVPNYAEGAEVSPPLPLVFIVKDFALIGSLEQPVGSITFLRTDEGQVTWLSTNLRLHARTESP